MLLITMTVGCGNSNVDSDATTVNSIDFYEENGGNQENNNENLVQQSNSIQSQSDDVQLQSDSNTSQADDAKPQADSKLDGSIESIGDNGVTISKILHPSENLAVSSNELVTVYFSEETEFEVWTVQNGGVNGDADTEKQQGAFSDLNLGANIRMTGSYDGSVFNANYVIIYNFV